MPTVPALPRWALLCLVTLCAPLAACQRSTPAAGPAAPVAPRVEVVAAVKHSFRGLLPITGELRPVQEVTLKSRVGGNVVELRYDEGDAVKKGALIARIEDKTQQAQSRNARASVQLAEAGLERARADLERLTRDKARIETLYARGAIDRKAFDDIQSAVRLGQATLRTAEAQVQQSQAGRDAAQVAVDETQYRAPFDGVISRRGVNLYEYIDTFKNRDIVTIVDTSAMELVASVAADLAGGVTKGAQVAFKVGALPDKTLTGEVIAVNPSADPRTRTIRLRVRLPNEGGLLKGGMYATGAVIVGGERVGVGVPQEAVHKLSEGAEGEGEAAERSVVWRVKNGNADRVVVTTGALDGDLIEIASGVADGDAIVVSSPGALRPGLAVLSQQRGAAASAEAPRR